MKKVISIVFIVSLLMSVFAFSACSKKVEDVQQSSWFSANTFDLDINVEGEISGIFPYAYCYLNDKIYVSAVVAGKFPKDDFQTSKGFIIEADSNNGQTTGVVNYKDILQEALPATVGADNAVIYGMFPSENKVNVFVTASNYSTGCDGLYSLEYDPETQKFDNYTDYSDIVIDTFMGSYICDMTPLNDMTLAVVDDCPFDNHTYIMYFLKDNSPVSMIDLKEVVNTQVNDYYGCILNDNRLLVEVGVEKDNVNVKEVVTVDLTNFSTSVSEDISAFKNADNVKTIAGDGKVLSVASSSDGIYRSENGVMQKFVDYNFTDVNIYTARNSNVIAATENKIILCGAQYDSATLVTGKPHIRISVLTLEDSNPYDKKTKLTVADMNGDIDYAVSEAIRSFNSTNEEYYIELRVYTSDANSSGLYALTEITNNVLIDIKNGNSPDIILNGAAYQELNNPEYVLDLTSYIDGSDINDTNYFMNIISANKVGDAIYQIPLTGNIFGVRGRADYSDGYSFTPSQYSEFVSNAANGYDPIAVYSDADKNTYFETIIGPHIGDFINYQAKEVDFN